MEFIGIIVIALLAIFFFDLWFDLPLNSINKLVLKIRGLDARDSDIIAFEEAKKRYEGQKVTLRNDWQDLQKDTQGIVIQYLESSTCIVNFDGVEYETPEQLILLHSEMST